ncbi:hypothetical protein GCM10025868_20280 [Angustibacter aerolatus]|uniref:Uncharacterized protein n=1 Tax=Angustibacter aerolatus TaxID=1162965 RepID=A0ABQ6JH97_9ACTN|nr:hypothetical protein GCM10025868_20280 [Angustibacter aerolatus]
MPFGTSDWLITSVRPPASSHFFQAYCGWSIGMCANQGSSHVAQVGAVSAKTEAQSSLPAEHPPEPAAAW